MSRTPIALALVALAIAIFSLVRSNASSPALEVQKTTAVDGDVREEAEEEHVEVAIYMGRLQRFHQKWWAAGRAENTELAKFYLHEMEEAMEVVADGNVMHEGVDVSNFMRIYGEKTIESLETTLQEKGVKAMAAQGHVLVENCNACHVASGYPFIRIKEPMGMEFPDQDFRPLPSK